MKKQYIRERETNLEELTQSIAEFLRQIDLKANMEETATGYEISAYAKTNQKTAKQAMHITIDGKPEEFTIEIKSTIEKPKLRNIWLMHMFGAGAILVRQWREEELWMKIERELWRHIETLIEQI
jgi:predicted ATP-grasp superfamily ATP-dependent carboligase